MIHVTTDQLLNVWMQLEDALNGNGLDEGHTAEIYRLSVQRYAMIEVGAAATEAERTLLDIYNLFAEKRDANITMVRDFGHRQVVEVTLSKGPAGKVIIPKEFR